jgi:hypothetical protein
MQCQATIFNKAIVLLLFFIMVLPGIATGQDSPGVSTDTGCIQKDLGDLLRAALHKPPRVKKEAEGSLLLLPIIGSNPATGFMVGVGGQYAFKMKGSSLYSSFSGSAQFTTKSQVIFMLKNNVYTRSNNIFFSGDWRYLVYSQSTYGLGTNSPVGGIIDYQYSLAGTATTEDSLAQDMKFNFARFHQSVSYKILEGLYAGLGFYYDSYNKIKDEKLRLAPPDTFFTSHYLYNTSYGFNTTGYSISAVNINLVYDTRDNMINPYKGIYAMASWRGGFTFLGNKNYSNFTQLEFRGYHSFSKVNPRHLIAVWLMGDFSPKGELPYLVLPATSYDQRGRSGRGYTQGRYRGANLVYGEAEYRFPISKCGGILGGVVFLNGTTADNPSLNLKLFESIKPGYGAGLRIMVDKKSRTNLAVDVGFGDNSFGFYLAASEAF